MIRQKFDFPIVCARFVQFKVGMYGVEVVTEVFDGCSFHLVVEDSVFRASSWVPMQLTLIAQWLVLFTCKDFSLLLHL